MIEIMDNFNLSKTTLHTFNGAPVWSLKIVKLAVKAEPIIIL